MSKKKEMNMNLAKENPHCKGCIYLCNVTSGFVHCDYIGYVGHSRGCPVDGCTEKVEHSKRKKSIPVFIKFCEGCGARFKTAGSRTRYCPDCKKRMKEEQKAKK